jgi:hypothetical protein
MPAAAHQHCTTTSFSFSGATLQHVLLAATKGSKDEAAFDGACGHEQAAAAGRAWAFECALDSALHRMDQLLPQLRDDVDLSIICGSRHSFS